MAKDNKKLLSRLSRIEGQVRGVKKMVEQEKYCVDVITQTSAIRSALASVENQLLKGHLSHCVIEHIQKGKSKKAVDEIMQIYELKRK